MAGSAEIAQGLGQLLHWDSDPYYRVVCPVPTLGNSRGRGKLVTFRPCCPLVRKSFPASPGMTLRTSKQVERAVLLLSRILH
jgi:hypothetical protein